ncbi:sensor histidine kinase [Aeoliella mucimassa]|uniref:histidine kinase n=1 Tax=Aeoliella mucimassa TaxID=2527972 RepID=A0A518AHH2_9BACT|nr:ATP-binding protein [Aeoliella mucimassa]QDU54170.1 Sensor protein ZraS [Aeoliella mucimassa]
MSNIAAYTSAFQSITERVLNDMFGLGESVPSPVIEVPSVETSKNFIVSLFYTGSVYGEYLLAMDEEVAARVVGIDQVSDGEDRDIAQETICDALTETLNLIVGEAVVELQDCYAKLTITAPRVYFGKIRYPQFRTGKAVLQTSAGEIECFFCLDQMRLSLAASYDEAMDSLMVINKELKEANRHLAEQQAQLVHAEKMATVGMLASGVAHEINNPLFFLDMNLETLNENVSTIEGLIQRYERIEARVAAVEQQLEDEGFERVLTETKEVVTEAREGVERIKNIVRSLKEFSDVDRSGFADSDINMIAKNVCNLISHLLPKGCQVEQEFEEVPRLNCNAGEMSQALANILTNAAQAVGEDGHIVVGSHVEEDCVVLSFTDNGVGIDADNLDRLFDPFFTTKEEGQGSGLGLSISYGIIKKHKGVISVESTLGEGTTFKVRLPFTTPEASYC